MLSKKMKEHETNMLLHTQNTNENNFQQHVSSIRPLKNKLLTDENSTYWLRKNGTSH